MFFNEFAIVNEIVGVFYFNGGFVAVISVISAFAAAHSFSQLVNRAFFKEENVDHKFVVLGLLRRNVDKNVLPVFRRVFYGRIGEVFPSGIQFKIILFHGAEKFP